MVIHVWGPDWFKSHHRSVWASRWLSSKASTCNAGAAGDTGLIPGSGRSSGEDHGNPLQFSCLGRPTVRRAWWAIAKIQTRLKQLSTHTHTHTGQCKWKHWNTGMALVCSKQASWAPAACPCCGILRNKRNMEPNCGEHSNRLKALSWR